MYTKWKGYTIVVFVENNFAYESISKSCFENQKLPLKDSEMASIERRQLLIFNHLKILVPTGNRLLLFFLFLKDQIVNAKDTLSLLFLIFILSVFIDHINDNQYD